MIRIWRHVRSVFLTRFCVIDAVAMAVVVIVRALTSFILFPQTFHILLSTSCLRECVRVFVRTNAYVLVFVNFFPLFHMIFPSRINNNNK